MSNRWRVVFAVLASGALIPTFGGCGGDTSDGGTSGGTSGASGKGGSAGSSSGGSAGSGETLGSGGASGSGGTSGSGGASGSGGLPDDYFACADTSECMVREAGCCELCGPNTAAEAIAFNRAYREQVSTLLCEDHPDPCPVADCALRPMYVLPFCIEGRCQVIDIRDDLLTSCGTDAQCTLRWGTVCCEACHEANELLVAVNSQVDYDATVCGTQGSCPPCVPPEYPPDARAVCNPAHHCEVQRR